MSDRLVKRMECYRKEHRDVAHEIDKQIAIKLESRIAVTFLENGNIEEAINYLNNLNSTCDKKIKRAEKRELDIDRAYATTLAAWKEM